MQFTTHQARLISSVIEPFDLLAQLVAGKVETKYRWRLGTEQLELDALGVLLD